MREDRWPPVHDFEALAEYVSELSRAESLDARFWSLGDLGKASLPPLCQGDIIDLAAPLPMIADDGVPILSDDVSHWLVIGNSCDADRPVSEVAHSQIVPLLVLGDAARVGPSRLAQLRSYDAFRGFYVPPWPGGDDLHRLADFTRPVTIHKGAVPAHAKVVARMQQHAWVLLHSCIVRFLARDDGRHD